MLWAAHAVSGITVYTRTLVFVWWRFYRVVLLRSFKFWGRRFYGGALASGFECDPWFRLWFIVYWRMVCGAKVRVLQSGSWFADSRACSLNTGRLGLCKRVLTVEVVDASACFTSCVLPGNLVAKKKKK